MRQPASSSSVRTSRWKRAPMHRKSIEHIFLARVCNFNDNDQSTQTCAPDCRHVGCRARFGHNFLDTGTWQCAYLHLVATNTHFNFSVFNFHFEHGSAHSPGHTIWIKSDQITENQAMPNGFDDAHCILQRYIWHQINAVNTRDSVFVWALGDVCISCLESDTDRHQWRCMCLFSCLNASLMPMKTPLILSHHFY